MRLNGMRTWFLVFGFVFLTATLMAVVHVDEEEVCLDGGFDDSVLINVQMADLFAKDGRQSFLVTLSEADVSDAFDPLKMMVLSSTWSDDHNEQDFVASGAYHDVRGTFVFEQLMERHASSRRLVEEMVPEAVITSSIPVSNTFVVDLTRSEVEQLSRLDAVQEILVNKPFHIDVGSAEVMGSNVQTDAEEDFLGESKGTGMVDMDPAIIARLGPISRMNHGRYPTRSIVRERVIDRPASRADIAKKSQQPDASAAADRVANSRRSDQPIVGPQEDHPKEQQEMISDQWEVQWNVEKIGASRLWKEFKTTGQGMVYAVADTGVDWMHENIHDNYLGMQSDGSAKHDYAWYDGVRAPVIIGSEESLGIGKREPGKCGYRSEVPCDDQGHGTHVTSTAVGTNGFGVAPGAKWMACRNMDRGDGSSETYLNCLNFFLAPHDLQGRNPDPKRRPHAIGNSYGCPAREKCSKTAFHQAVNALRAAGIFMSVSAGNEGPRCGSVQDPPALEPQVISVAATDRADALAYFSSRGPVIVVNGVTPYRKPDLAAPGQGVKAAYPGNSYRSLSGTSMASPHVGAAALLLGAVCPFLNRNVDHLQFVMQQTAVRLYPSEMENLQSTGSMQIYCGNEAKNSWPNNYYGHGRIDVMAAAHHCRREMALMN